MTDGPLRRTALVVAAALLFGVACSGDGGRERRATPTRGSRHSTATVVRFVGAPAVAAPAAAAVTHTGSRSSRRSVRRSSDVGARARAAELPAPAGTLPNLRPVLVADEIRSGFPDEGPITRRHTLRFTVDSLNAGDYPMEIFSTPKGASTDEDAAQCVGWNGRVCEEYQPVGEMYFHQEHVHWHFKDYARYELRRVTNGRVVNGPGGVVVSGGKVSFCLMDTFGPSFSTEATAADPWLVVPVYNTCNPLVQGISPKWTDRYEWNLPGQTLELDGVADGIYALVVTLNPSRALSETTYDDNTVTAMLRIGTDAAGDRTVDVVPAAA